MRWDWSVLGRNVPEPPITFFPFQLHTVKRPPEMVGLAVELRMCKMKVGFVLSFFMRNWLVLIWSFRMKPATNPLSEVLSFWHSPIIFWSWSDHLRFNSGRHDAVCCWTSWSVSIGLLSFWHSLIIFWSCSDHLRFNSDRLDAVCCWTSWSVSIGFGTWFLNLLLGYFSDWAVYEKSTSH